jgi:hypothetical protein
MGRYVFLVEWPNPKSGLVSWVSTPRFSQGYCSVQNRPSLLIETHMLKEYSLRVDGTYETIKRTIEILDRERSGLRKAIEQADAYTATGAFRKKRFPLRFAVDRTDSVMIDFKGVSYDSVKSEVTGGTWYKFSGTPETFKVAYFPKQKILATADLPEAYVVPPEWTSVIERLELHGVELARLDTPVTIEVQTYRFSKLDWERTPNEGRHPVRFEIEPFVETREFPAGSVVIDMNQRASQVVAHILEPRGPDSYVQWGFFDSIFEQVEYADSYVIEEMARDMLAIDPNLQAELEAKKAAEPEFAKDPRAIRQWFYRRTTYWDDRKDVYPVGKIFERDVVDRLRMTR